MNEASKAMLLNTVKEWMKFVNEREKMRGIATEVAVVAQKIVFESLNFLKAQNVDVECQDVKSMKIMGHPVVVEPAIEATFPNVKTKVNMTCSGATRAIVINPNGSISAGGNPFMFDQLKKAIPDTFTTNAAEFVSDAFLFIARNQTLSDTGAQQPQTTAPQASAPVSAPQAATPVAAPQQPKPPQAIPQQPRPPQPQRPAQPPQPQRPPAPKPPGT